MHHEGHSRSAGYYTKLAQTSIRFGNSGFLFHHSMTEGHGSVLKERGSL